MFVCFYISEEEIDRIGRATDILILDMNSYNVCDKHFFIKEH